MSTHDPQQDYINSLESRVCALAEDLYNANQKIVDWWVCPWWYERSADV